MTNATEIGQQALPSWRGVLANRVAPTAAKRTPLSEEQIRAMLGGVFLAVSTFYVISSIARMVQRAREG